jgi:hypothetical protein
MTSKALTLYRQPQRAVRNHHLKFVWVVVFIVFSHIAFLIYLAAEWTTPDSKWGPIGDFYGGVLGTALNFLAIALLLYDIQLQKQEMRETKKLIEEQEKALKMQNELALRNLRSQEIQRFLEVFNSYNKTLAWRLEKLAAEFTRDDVSLFLKIAVFHQQGPQGKFKATAVSKNLYRAFSSLNMALESLFEKEHKARIGNWVLCREAYLILNTVVDFEDFIITMKNWKQHSASEEVYGLMARRFIEMFDQFSGPQISSSSL